MDIHGREVFIAGAAFEAWPDPAESDVEGWVFHLGAASQLTLASYIH